MSANDVAPLGPLPGDETNANEEGGGVASLPIDETNINEEGLPSSLLLKLMVSKYNSI